MTCLAGGIAVPPAHATGDDVARWRPFVDEASSRFGVPVAWIERVMTQESGGRTELHGRPITSVKGAMGLMQLMPLTWRTMRAELALGADPYDPHDNIIAGTAYLRWLYDQFGYPGLFAAYSAGPGHYNDYIAGRRGLPAETRHYTPYASATRSEASLAVRSVSPRPSGVFAIQSGAAQSMGTAPRPTDGLFALSPSSPGTAQ